MEQDRAIEGGREGVAADRGPGFSPVRELVCQIVAEAVAQDAASIHIEPSEERDQDLQVRFRTAGPLRIHRVLEMDRLKDIVGTIKEMSALSPAEDRLPQDGRFTLRVTAPAGDRDLDRVVDVRASVIPLTLGLGRSCEKVVMRVLSVPAAPRRLSDLGLDGSSLESVETDLGSPYGLVLVAGPAGSGRTTTVYSMIATCDHTRVNVCSVEDPFEYRLRGVSQIHCRPEIGLTASAALRSLLRQDPDVIAVSHVGEYETAEIAIKLAMMGHLVIGAIHADSAVSALGRLLDMGVECSLVDAGLLSVVAQRLVRKVCRCCRQERIPGQEEIDLFRLTPGLLTRLGIECIDPSKVRLVRGEGCPACSNTGYQQRIGVFEYLRMGPSIRKALREGASAIDLVRQARQEGMLTLREAALRHALMGVTSTEEVVRVTATDEGCGPRSGHEGV